MQEGHLDNIFQVSNPLVLRYKFFQRGSKSAGKLTLEEIERLDQVTFDRKEDPYKVDQSYE
jgi:hypothetical protein